MKKPAADESIGRPADWSEGRYQKPGSPIDESVLTPPKTAPEASEIVSTPVTRKDYESLEKPPKT